MSVQGRLTRLLGTASGVLLLCGMVVGLTVSPARMSFGQANRPATSTGPNEVFLVFDPDPSNKQILPKGESAVILPSGPKGEPAVTDGAIEVDSFDFGMENSPNIGSAATGAAGAGKAKFHDFTIKKAVDATSPLLFEASATNHHYNIVRLVLRRSGAKLPYLVFTFKLVGVKSVDWSGHSGGDRPQEQVVFEYGSVAITYRKPNPDGSLGSPTFQSWNRISNTPDASLTQEVKP